MDSNTFNKNLLIIARQARKMSQASLARKTGLTQGFLSKVENGLTEPSEDAVQKFVDVLSFPKSFFYQSERTHHRAAQGW